MHNFHLRTFFVLGERERKRDKSIQMPRLVKSIVHGIVSISSSNLAIYYVINLYLFFTFGVCSTYIRAGLYSPDGAPI